jgi:murein DD-endopeptidase MepM/ murein hydrolase activator NlpD
MLSLKPILAVTLVAVFLTSCAGNASPTPTAPQVPDIFLTYTPAPSAIAPTPSGTPPLVLPPVGSSTPDPLRPTPTFPPINTGGPMIAYNAQGGDTLGILAKRFDVEPGEIISGNALNLPEPGVLLEPGILLLIPNRVKGEIGPSRRTIPDSEVVFARSAVGFDIAAYVDQQQGHLAAYTQYLKTYGWTSGAQAVEYTARDNSLSPRMVLAVIEYESHWVLGNPTNLAQDDYPLGNHHPFYRGLFRQLMWASAELSEGYYRWRSGDLKELTFTDGSKVRLDPRLNAGTAALQYFFSLNHTRAYWDQAVAPGGGFDALYTQMFGDPWERARAVEPLIPTGLVQPPLSLPFEPGQLWSFSNGPHSAWQVPDGSIILVGGALAALDFAPAAIEHGCVKSDKWVVAPASGFVVRAANNVVVLDLDGDGLEQTGWNILFLHIAKKDSVKAGIFINKDDRIGHPSCEGGDSTGTHVHIARKYNGEWVLVDSPVPFDMDGWVARGNGILYKGSLTRGDQTIEACACGTFTTRITRDKKDEK